MRITASDIRKGMARQWFAPEYAVLWEVCESTGQKSGRRADAVIMSLWPSRGLELHGVEIKVSRSDWLVEAKDPTKAEAVAKYCDRWWLHAAPSVVKDISELPQAWGLREFDGKSWRTIKEAEKTEALPPSRSFLAAVLRRADGTIAEMVREAKAAASASAAAEIERSRARLKDEIERAVERRAREATDSLKAFEKFRSAFGDDALSPLFDHAALGRAARMIADAATSWSVHEVAKNLRGAADALDAIRAIKTGAQEGGE